MFRPIAIGATLIAVIVSGNAAFAADLPEPGPAVAQPQVASAPFAMWNGCFVGGNGGVALVTWDVTVPPVNLPAKSADGIALGGQIGCDYQVGNLVIGIQGMGDGIGGAKANVPVPGDPQIQEKWFATATGRVGYAVEPAVLPYVKGGAGWAGQEGTGWTVGAGIEWKCLPSLSVFVEYDYLGFGSKALNLATTPPLSANSSVNVQAILVGLNYRFDFGTSVTTRY
jgi:outer membrane immunogenic protein